MKHIVTIFCTLIKTYEIILENINSQLILTNSFVNTCNYSVIFWSTYANWFRNFSVILYLNLAVLAEMWNKLFQVWSNRRQHKESSHTDSQEKKLLQKIDPIGYQDSIRLFI